MAPSRPAAAKSVPSKDPRHSRSEHDHERRIYSISESASRDDDSASVISGQYETDSGIEDTPPEARFDRRRETEYRPAAPVAQQTRPTRGIQFDRLNQDTSLTRVDPQTQVMRGEVQRRESDGIQPVQLAEKPAKSAVSLRLDLNLDIEVDLKASIRGDLTLTLL